MTDHGDAMTTVTACTIVARNYLPAARVLAGSYLEHHPGHDFVIAVIDEDSPLHNDGGETGCRVVGPSAFGIDEDTYLRMATAYSVTELATAVKPYLLRELRRDGRVVVYLDPDIRVFAPMPELAELACTHGIVLTPHFRSPLPQDGNEPDDSVIMGTGIFNLGFIAVGPGSAEFLDFWAQRLRHDAIVAPEKQLFTDQRWVDQVPALFDHYILRDPGFNAAYWNLHERVIGRNPDGVLTANDSVLRFFHFSGYRPEQSWLLSYHCARKPRTLLSEEPELRALCDNYGAALKAEGYAETLEAVPYGFAEFSDGSPLPPLSRQVFRDAWVAAERKDESPPPHAFGADGGKALRKWLSSPADQGQAAAGLNRLTMAVWESRTDLKISFPHPCGVNAAEFRTWCERSGTTENSLPAWAMPVTPQPPSPPQEDFGVNMLGYLTAELGLGEMGRIVHDTIVHAEIPVVSVLEERLLSNRTGMDAPDTVGRPRFPISLIAVNADQTRAVLTNHPETEHQRYRIGLWAWELEDFPQWQHDAFDLVDEVWTVSDFCRHAIAMHSPVPVKTIPVPVRDPGPPLRRPRSGDETLTFLFAFDFNSVAQRKNPWGTVEAFRRAFPDQDDVRLVIKTINSRMHPQSSERLHAIVAGDERIELIEHYLSAAELHELYERSHCYVSLHRSEGFGLTVAEAMVRGMPVISTDYSSTTEFLDETTGWPIPYHMVQVGKNCYPYHPEAVWAEPDIEAAAAAMREIAQNPVEAARRGAAAREYILRTRSMASAAAWMRAELEQAYRTWKIRQAEPAPEPEHPLTPMRASREALRWRAEPGSASRTPLAPTIRKAVLRVLDHYDVHQRKVMSTLHESTENTLMQLLSRIESLEATVDQTNRIAVRGDQLATQQRIRLDTQEKSLEQLHAHLGDHSWLRDTVAKLSDNVAELSAQLESSQHAVHDMLRYRDERLDSDEKSLQRLIRDVSALHEMARVAHEPIPVDAEAVACDAGILLMPADDVFLPWIEHHRSWEASEASLMAELMRQRPGLFVDVGTHVGYHTLRLLRSCPKMTGVVAAEADPTNASFLRRNLAVNLGPTTRAQVHVHEVAAWDTDGHVRLSPAAENNSGDIRAYVWDAQSPGMQVPAVRLESIPELRNQQVSLVKTDLQGRDHRALAGLNEILMRDRPHVVCEFDPAAIEELGDDPAQVLAGYRKLGYEPTPVPGHEECGHITDGELVNSARTDESGFLTLWLKPY